MIPKRVLEADIAWGASRLVPAVVQDVADGRVLMVAYLDAEALAKTMATGEVHFHSRSRDRLWRKGETSGNVLRLAGIDVDCDGDALLLSVNPVGPTCHRGTRSCFDPEGSVAPSPRSAVAAPAVETAASREQGFQWLETLWATIESRVGADPAVSYTAALLAGGVDAPARKVAEEAVEVVMAAKDHAAATPDRQAATRDALAGEAADLLYHTLVMLRERGLPPSEVIARLRDRHRA